MVLDGYDLETDEGLSDRISTRTRVKAKKLVPIEVGKIRPTGPMDWDIKEIRYSPICLIKDFHHDCYYIADGNHRFFTKLLVHKSKFINAWVLEEGDQQKIHGNPLPTRLEDWKKGDINLNDLCLMAREAHKINEESINKDLELCLGGINNSDADDNPEPVNNPVEVTNLADFLKSYKE